MEEFSNRGQAAKMWRAFMELAQTRGQPRAKNG
jgi:hypothetical protein